MVKKTIEELYQKKTPIEHILLRPETYIGPVDQHQQAMYILQDGKIKQKTVSYVPGLYKIFDEILVNAADNKIRDPKMNKLIVDITKNKISVWNNGKGVPIKIHKKENVYVPELIFGQLLTSSNYDDKEKKVTGGRNGYGAKLCNIFSKEFIIETADKAEKTTYYQRYSKNMSKREDPIIKKERVEESFTRITFVPDLKRFGMETLDDETIALLKKRVYDMGATVKKVKIILNNEEIPIKSFKDYVLLHFTKEPPMVHTICNERWEIAILPSEDQFQQVSFVNSICTIKGGTHVNHVLDQIMEPLIDKIQKKGKGLTIKPLFVKNSMFIFVNCLIENPSFDSQTKETLTLRANAFGSTCGQIKEKTIKEIVDLLGESIISYAQQKQSKQLKKTDGAKTSRITVEKLDDANRAGTKDSSKCSLILTEGDSAKSFAIRGVEAIKGGRDLFGVFPLRGKMVNVRDAAHDKIMKNEEIISIKKAIGLQQGKVYESIDSLRYGSVIIMTDQDHDGSHIKGLVINFFEHYFPSLLKLRGFLKEFVTPIVKVTKVKRRRPDTGSAVTLETESTVGDNYAIGTVLEFYTLPEYFTWRETINNFNESWSSKYYKGLGSNNAKDAIQYFSNLDKHLKEFSPMTVEDKTAIELAFSKNKADDRKFWLQDCSPETFLDHSIPRIRLQDFIHREFILFSMADNIRSIPSMVDGFKPGQRKVMYICFKNNIVKAEKVVQLSGKVLEQGAYHHGEMSLHQTIIKLAQNFVGSNNINLLFPDGEFGSRRKGGKDASSARYIATGLAKIARKIFKESDDPILTHIEDDNVKAEPIYYVPIIPMILINGSDGIGTGWSTKIHNYNLTDIIENIERIMENKELKKMSPWYRGFKGTIEEVSNNKYDIKGIYDLDEDELNITELPIRVWTDAYKSFLDNKRIKNEIKDFTSHHYSENIHFKVILNERPRNLEKDFGLKSASLFSNLVLFDRNRKIKKYENVEEILKDFYSVRIDFYNLRKQYLIKELENKIAVLQNKVRFISEFVNNQLIIMKRKKVDICSDLVQRGYMKIMDKYDYLLDMSIMSLTYERIEALNKERDARQAELDDLLPKTAKDLWKIDLQELKIEYEAFLDSFNEDNEIPTTDIKRRKKKLKKIEEPVKKKKNVDDKKKKQIKKKDSVQKELKDEKKIKKVSEKKVRRSIVSESSDDSLKLSDEDIQIWKKYE